MSDVTSVLQILATTSNALANEQKVSSDLRKKLTEAEENLKVMIKKEKDALELVKKTTKKALTVVSQTETALSLVNTLYRPIVIKFGEGVEFSEGIIKVVLGQIPDGTKYGAKVSKDDKYNIKTFLGNGCMHIPEQGYVCHGRSVDTVSDVIVALTSLKENLPGYLTEEKIKEIKERKETSPITPEMIVNALSAALAGSGFTLAGTPVLLNQENPAAAMEPTTQSAEDEYIPDDE